MIGEYDYNNPPQHSHIARDVVVAGFFIGAATRPRAFANFFLIIGVFALLCTGIMVVFPYLEKASAHEVAQSESIMVWTFFVALFCFALAAIIRFIGFLARLVLGTTQDVIHDRY